MAALQPALEPVLAELVEAVRAAAADRTPLNICGGSTKAFYGGPMQGRALELRALAGIASYEPTELVVTVRAGTPLAELEAVLAAQGQCLAFEPPRYAPGGTVGGMVAAGLAGPPRPAVGGVRDHLLGATVINGRAELLSFGGQVMKNVAGYDAARVLAGSMGVLGVICEVSLKVLPMAPAQATLRFEWPEDKALAQLHAWGAQPLPIHASAWWNGMLVLRLAGAEAAVIAAAERLGGDLVAPDMAEPFWTGLRDHTDEFFQSAHEAVARGATLWRLSLPVATPALKLPGEHLVDWGGAQRWVVTSRPAPLMRELAAQVGGHATVFAGPKGPGVFTPLGAAEAKVQRALKAAFDPQGIFNPGRLYPEW
jgi:glycolate oxidase FAD binding subunit